MFEAPKGTGNKLLNKINGKIREIKIQCRVCVWVQYNTAVYFNIIIIKQTNQIVQGETVNNYAARESLLGVKSYLKSHVKGVNNNK